jgi:glyoxylase-like metal-dependent hydrolase (beta-lactamase superfamily II)
MIQQGLQQKVRSYPILNVKVFFIQTDSGYLLVDAGIPFQEKQIDRAFRVCGVDPQSVTRILLTHGHLDHIGCLAYVQRITGAGIICHRAYARDLEEGRYEEAVPRSLFWRVFNQPISRMLGATLPGVKPDIVIEEELDLSPLGISGRFFHTPGHSPGSCSILLDNGETLIGDLLRENRSGGIDTGLFYSDRDQILKSLRMISGLNPQVIYLSHGETLSGEEFCRGVSRFNNSRFRSISWGECNY